MSIKHSAQIVKKSTGPGSGIHALWWDKYGHILRNYSILVNIFSYRTVQLPYTVC